MIDKDDDAELIQALLQCQDDWHKVVVFRLFGRDEQANALELKLSNSDE